MGSTEDAETNSNTDGGVKRLPNRVARELAVRSSTDPRTVVDVYRHPASADRNTSRERAFRALCAAGYLAGPTAAAARRPRGSDVL